MGYMEPDRPFVVYAGYDEGPQNESIYDVPAYIPYNDETAEDLQQTLAVLSFDERKKLTRFSESQRERSIALRAALNRNLSVEEYEKVDIPMVIDRSFYVKYMSKSRPDVGYMYNGQIYPGVVEFGTNPGEYVVYSTSDDGPQGESLEDAPLYMKSTFTKGPTVADVLSSRNLLDIA